MENGLFSEKTGAMDIKDIRIQKSQEFTKCQPTEVQEWNSLHLRVSTQFSVLTAIIAHNFQHASQPLSGLFESSYGELATTSRLKKPWVGGGG